MILYTIFFNNRHKAYRCPCVADIQYGKPVVMKLLSSYLWPKWLWSFCICIYISHLSVGHCVVYPSIYWFWLPIWYRKTLLCNQCLFITSNGVRSITANRKVYSIQLYVLKFDSELR